MPWKPLNDRELHNYIKAMVKALRCEGEGAIVVSLHLLRNFALSPHNFALSNIRPNGRKCEGRSGLIGKLSSYFNRSVLIIY